MLREALDQPLGPVFAVVADLDEPGLVIDAGADDVNVGAGDLLVPARAGILGETPTVGFRFLFRAPTP